jgi:hypothetical protein
VARDGIRVFEPYSTVTAIEVERWVNGRQRHLMSAAVASARKPANNQQLAIGGTWVARGSGGFVELTVLSKDDRT